MVYQTNKPGKTVLINNPNFTTYSICTGVGLNGTLVETKIRTFKCPKYAHLFVPSAYTTVASTRVPFRPTMVHMSNFALIRLKWITVYQAPTLYKNVSDFPVPSRGVTDKTLPVQAN